jgi:hypothetical protein
LRSLPMPRAACWVLKVLTALFVMLGYMVITAGTASATAACSDGSRESAAAIAGDYDKRDAPRHNTIPEPVHAGFNGDNDMSTVVKLRYAEAPYHCVWALIADPQANGRDALATTAWIDRRKPGQTNWDGPLGTRAIQGGNGTTYTAAYSIAGYEARACGVWRHLGPEAHCTAWFQEPASAPVANESTSGAPDTPVKPNVPDSPAGEPSGRQQLAAAILAASDRIVLDNTHEELPAGDSATALHNIQSTAAGHDSDLSNYKNAKAYRDAHKVSSTSLSEPMLKAVLEISKHYSVRISEISGASHSLNSGHYRGLAVDFAAFAPLTSSLNGNRISPSHYAEISNLCRANGASTIYDPAHDPQFPSHQTHVHCEWR